jgi:hypothetical protein
MGGEKTQAKPVCPEEIGCSLQFLDRVYGRRVGPVTGEGRRGVGDRQNGGRRAVGQKLTSI